MAIDIGNLNPSLLNVNSVISLSISELNSLYPTPNSTLTTDLSVAPYYDDYDQRKGYYKILYRPGYAVQARELTQMQTMLQKQIARFGKHVFKEGSIVIPGEFSIETTVDYIKLEDSDSLGNPINPKDFLNTTITNNQGVTAYVVDYADKDTTNGYPKTLFVRYISASPANPSLKTFSAGETLNSSQGTVIIMNDMDVVGLGSRFIIREGVFFAKEHFIWFPTQSIILDRYSTKPTSRVGFQVLESLIRYSDDSTLLDPALESSNYAAPGADRLQLNPILIAKPYDDTTGAPDFVELFRIKEGIVTELFSRPQYNILADEMAKRTLDQSGDYYVRGLGVRVREHLDINNNGGYLNAANGGNPDLLAVGIEPGLAYVKGYERQTYVTNYIEVDKSEDFRQVNSQFSTATMGNYLICQEYVGNIYHDQENIVTLLDTPSRYSSNTNTNSTLLGTQIAGSSNIGTARVRHVEWYSGFQTANNSQFLIYLNDIRMVGSNSTSNIKSLVHIGGTFGADVVTVRDKSILQETASDILLYYTGEKATRNVTDAYGNFVLSYEFKRTDPISFTSGVATVIPSFDVAEQFPFTASTSLSAQDKKNLILTMNLPPNQDLIVGAPVYVISATSRVDNYNFTVTSVNGVAPFNPGEWVQFTGAGNSKYYLVTAVSGLNVTVSEVLPASLTSPSASLSKVFQNGDVFDLTGISGLGLNRTVVAGTGTQGSIGSKSLTINLQSPIFDASTNPAAQSFTLTYPVIVNNAKPARKILRSNCFVTIDLTSGQYASNTIGPYSLGVPDVLRIRSIRSRTDGTVPTGLKDPSSADATSSFILDNGQRDDFYDFASIKPRTSIPSTTKLLVNFDYFEPSFTNGLGYFVVDSYPVNNGTSFNPDTDIRTENIPVYISPTTRDIYDLRNHIDFRPVKKAKATYTTTPSNSTVNPGFSVEFYNSNKTGTALRLIKPSSLFNYSYSYYLARKDLIVMNKDGTMVVVRGVPSLNPITPQTPPNTMAICSIYIPPFPSLSSSYSKIINREDLSCVVKKLLNIRYTMRDIGVLKDRIVNLEYYASLNALQKNATDMAILDENGLNRFKNGIFVNDFTTHQFSDIRSPDYRIVIDPNEKCIRPFYTTDSIYYEYLPDESSGIQQSNDIFTLPYEEVPFIEQTAVTSARNVELSSYRFIGQLYLDPPEDVWIDTQYLPDETITIGPSGNNLPQPVIEWNEWQKKICGYYVEPSAYGNQAGWTYIDPAKLAGYPTSCIPPNLICSPNSPRDQRITEIDDFCRTGTQTTYGISENSIQLGGKVVDISAVPYIRPQTIDINGKGFKACTRLYLFFDGERVDQYCAPMTVYDYILTPEQRSLGYTPTNTSFIVSNTANSILNSFYGNTYNTTHFHIFTPEYGAPLVTDDTGEVFLCLTLPADGSKQFRVGQKEVVLTDSITNSVDATTHASTYFYASGLTEYKQGTVLTTRSITSNVIPLYERKCSNTCVGYVNNPSCTAYSFYINAPPGEEGIFLTSVDVWYQRKHPTYGIWYEIREMDNAGNITRTQVPLSKKTLQAADIVASEIFDEGAYTRVQFDAPIFLYNNKEYAFVMHTVGLNPDAYVWIARLGEDKLKAYPTAMVPAEGLGKYQARPLTGTYYTTNNNMNWNMVDDIDMKIRFNRAKFQTGVPGTLVLGNYGREILQYDPNFTLNANITSDLGLKTAPVITQVVAPPITINYGETFINQQIVLRSNIGYFQNGDSIVCWSETEKKEKCHPIVCCKKSSTDSGDYTKISICNTRTVFECSNGYFKVIYGSNGEVQRVGGKSVHHDFHKFKCCCAKVKKCKCHHGHWNRKNKHCESGDPDYGPWGYCKNRWDEDNEEWFEPLLELEVTTYQRLSNGKTIFVGDVFKGYYEFRPGEAAVTATTNTVINIQQVREIRYSVIDFEPSFLNFGNTTIDFEMRTYANGSPGSPGSPGDYVSINPNQNYYFDTERAVYSRSHEYSLYGGDKTNKIRATFMTGSEYVSPILDLARTHTVYVDNIINCNIAATGANVYQDYGNECKASGGGIANKYISTVVTLAEGQDAEDMLVMLTAYKPPTTDVIVFAKFLHGEDSDTIAQRPWIPLVPLVDNAFSSYTNRNDYKEFSYGIPSNFMTGPATDNSSGGELQYYNSQGVLFTGYKYFQIKIALVGQNSAIIPKVADLRVTALQM